jgi:hypothetical protein
MGVPGAAGLTAAAAAGSVATPLNAAAELLLWMEGLVLLLGDGCKPCRVEDGGVQVQETGHTMLLTRRTHVCMPLCGPCTVDAVMNKTTKC